MRALVIASLLAVLSPAVALAQTSPAPSTQATAPDTTASTARTRGGDITRDEYVARAVERAKRAAEKRFDKMDANHDGVLTADERRAARAARRQQRDSDSQ